MSVKYPIIRPSLPALSEIAADFDEALSSGMVTTAGQTRLFEQTVAELLGVEHVVAVSSCTSGLMLSLRAMGLSGEVIIPSFTFTATALAAVWSGLKPVFCDCAPGTLTIDPDSMAEAISPETVAVMPVPVFGMPCDNDEILAIARQHGLRVVFDSAQALGAAYKGTPLGGFGDVEVFSLSPTKVITSVEGGLITTGNAELAGILRRMRDYGKNADGSDITDLGLSARFSELHAVVGTYNARRARDLMALRQQNIGALRERLTGIDGLRFLDTPADRASSGIYMVLRIVAREAGCSRDELVRRLGQRGVQARAYFTPPLHRQAVYQNVLHRLGSSLGVSERAASECMTIPLYADMSTEQLDEIAAEVRAAIAG